MFWPKRTCHRLVRLLPLILSFLLLGCGDQQEAPLKVSLEKRAPAADAPVIRELPGDSLRFGFDPRLNPKEDVSLYQPFLNYLEQQTGLKIALKFTEKYEDTVDNLGHGRVGLAAMGPVNCVIAKAKYGIGCLVMGLNHEHKPEYRAVIFTRTDSPLRRLEDLKDRAFAFGDYFSTQGHAIPRKMLDDAGVSLEELRFHVFTGSHANTVKAVLSGDYDAGAIQDSLALRLAAEGRIRILATSKPYPSSLICYNPDLDPQALARIKEALLALDPTGIHGELLVNWNRTEMPNGFVEYQPNSLREIEELVQLYLVKPEDGPATAAAR